MIIYHYLLWSLMYSFFGWVYESTLCSITGRKLVNRGFLNGPICPIYGFGAILVIACLSSINNVGTLFIISMILTCSLEYITSWLLEKLFHTRWWDYSRFKFQIKGRICLIGAIIFGSFSVVLLKFIHPYIKSLTLSISNNTIIILDIVFIIIVAIDITVTVIHIFKLNGKLKKLQLIMNDFIEESHTLAKELKETVYENFESSRFYNDRVKELLDNLNIQEHRLLAAFPNIRSIHYKEALEQLKDRRLKRIERLKKIRKRIKKH